MSYTKGMNTTHIASAYNNYESARTGFFMFIVPRDQLSNLPLPTYTGGDTEAIYYDADHAAEVVRLAVTSCPVPHYEVATETYRRGNDVVHFATVPTWNGGSIRVDDYVGLDTKSVLMAWLRLAYDPHTRKGGRMSEYKKNCKLVEYTQDYEEIRTWNLEGCFITGLSEDDFDRANDGKRQITASFIFDRAVMELPQVEEA